MHLQLSAMRLLRTCSYAALMLLLVTSSFYCKKSDKETPDPIPDPLPPSGPVEIVSKVLAQNLEYTWEILWGPDNFIWVTERGGKISRVNPANGAVTPVATIADVVSIGEGGLLGMVMDPNFNTNKYVYIVYNFQDNGAYKQKLVRLTYNGTTLTSPLVLKADIPATDTHNGSRLVIVGNKLFMSVGDEDDQTSPQDLNRPNGKVLRLNLDGSIPADNPVAGNPYWSFGHRNPQGMVYAHDILFSDEHGPNNDDEVNIIEKGRNYGWPDVQGLCDQPAEQALCTPWNVREPLKVWTPTIAPAGLDFYDSDSIPQWKGSLLMTTLKDQTLYQFKMSSDYKTIATTNEFFRGQYGRLRDVCISPNGRVYICTSNEDDKIIEIKAK